MVDRLTREELEAGLHEVLQSPKDQGLLKAIVIRPRENARRSLRHCQLSPERGLHGDAWAVGSWMSLPDGRPHPDVQVAIMNARAIALIARDETGWLLAGDNLYVDLDLSAGNLPPGACLSIGSAVLEITAVPHNACRKFAERFGIEATRFVNSRQGKQLRLRGVYARVARSGVVSIGDIAVKLQSDAQAGAAA